MSQSRTRYIGMDVHQASRAVAYGAHAYGAEVVSLGTMGTRQGESDKLMRQLQATSKQLGGVYDAGPWGSWLSRSLTKQGSPGWGVAPSLLPTKAGARVTTDRRDAMHRARRMRSGALTPGSVPALDDAAIWARRRARAETRRARKAAKLRRQACLVRHDLR